MKASATSDAQASSTLSGGNLEECAPSRRALVTVSLIILLSCLRLIFIFYSLATVTSFAGAGAALAAL